MRDKFTDKEFKEFRHIFHVCWGNAVTSPEYVKTEWQKLCKILREKGLELQ